MRRALVSSIFAFAACAAPDTPILPGKLDLPVAADCVLAPLDEPMTGYVTGLEALGWRKAEAIATGETWTRAGADCGILNVSGVRETYARKDYTLLRFEVSCATG
jgi:hypothetical protein